MAADGASPKSLYFDNLWLPSGWLRQARVRITAGMVEAIERDARPAPQETRHLVGLPGLPNLHSHAFQRGMAGQAEFSGPDNDNFWSWRSVMYRFLDRLTPEMVRDIAAMAYVEMMESGFTRVGEFHYLHNGPDGSAYDDPGEMVAALVAAAEATGIGMTMLPVFYAHGGFGGQPPMPEQRRFITALDGFARLHEAARRYLARLPDAVLGIAPHSLRAVTPEALRALLAIHPRGPIHIHIAEQMAEVAACLNYHGVRPVRHLLDAVGIDDRWCLVHATHIHDAEIEAVAATGAVVGLCPITEANLGDGLFPMPRFRQAAGRFGIGTDSNVSIDATEELRWLEYVQRLALQRRNVIGGASGESTGETLWREALAGGSQALGVHWEKLEGSPADFISLKAAHPAIVGDVNAGALNQMIFAGGRGTIDHVWRRGIAHVSDGRHAGRERIVQRYRTTMERLAR